MGGRVARRSSSRSSDWERWQRQQARETERQQRVTVAAAKAAERAKREQHVVDRKRETEHRTAEVARRVEQLGSILATGLQRAAGINFSAFKRRPSPPAFDPGTLAEAQPQPSWGQFAPSPPNALAALFGGRQRHEQRVAEAQGQYQQALRRWQEEDDARQKRLAAAQQRHQATVRAHLAESEEHNRRVDALATGFAARERQAVEDVLSAALGRVPLPADFPRRAEVTFSPDAEQLVVRLQLPGADVVPVVRGYKYVQTRDEIQAVPRPTKESGELYRRLLAQVSLLVLKDLFEADPHLATIAFNGHVDTTNPGTGQPEYPCLISLDVERATFIAINLHQVQPEVCLRHLRARVSPHPYELEPIEPILDFDLTKYAFVEGLDAVSSLDARPDLMQMGYTAFEHLVRQIFEAMGVESWTTQQSNDDGVDAVVVNRSPLLGRLSIVQAKRYKDAVGVNHIRELAGAIEEKKAGHGILVTTSWFTPRSWQKAREHGRIELIDGNRLIYLIKKHLGKDVLIGIKRPRTATTGPDAGSAPPPAP
jgi:restriction system protein